MVLDKNFIMFLLKCLKFTNWSFLCSKQFKPNSFSRFCLALDVEHCKVKVYFFLLDNLNLSKVNLYTKVVQNFCKN